MRTLKTGDPCPFCGMPIKLTDPETLRMLAIVAGLLGLPETEKEERTDEQENGAVSNS